MERYGVKPKFGTKKWFTDYYWYHYRWHTIAGLFGVLLIVMFIHDLASKEKYDAEISVNSTAYISSEQQDRLSSLLNLYIEDTDGDGAAKAGLFFNIMATGENADPQMLMASQTKFIVEISDGTSMIMILDDDACAQIEEPSFFADLSEFSDKAAGDGKRLYLRDTPLGEDPLLEPIADELFITLRAPDSHLVADRKKGPVAYEAARTLLKNLTADNKVQPAQQEAE